MTLTRNVQWGRVDAIDRANRVLRATLDSGAPIFDVAYDPRPSFAPWPFARARFVSSGHGWRCLGPIGHRRVIFHDDFTTVRGITVGAFAGGTVAQGTDGIGVLKLTTNTGNDSVSVDPTDDLVLPETHALHVTSRVAVGDAALGEWWVGLSDDEHVDKAIVVFDPTFYGDAHPRLVIRTAASGFADEALVQGVTVESGVWHVVDLIVQGGVYAAAWLDGDGPYRLDVPVQVPASGVHLHLLAAASNVGVPQSASFDWLTASAVTITGPVGSN